MKLNFLLILVLFLGIKSYAQDSKNILFTIDNEPYYTDEFMFVYKKNLHIVPDSNENSIENYLQLFVDYKLKVKSAKEAGLDTLQDFKNELSQYKSSLILPYLKDEKVTNKLVKEAYGRLKKEVKASHILIFTKPDDLPNDTLKAYEKILEARNLVLQGKDFSEVAKQYSQDPSVANNGGEIGYFTALQMVYPFENVAYTTAAGEVSKPFRTKFGFHILKVEDIRDSEGEVEVAHIMFKDNSAVTGKKVDSIYKVLLNIPASFDALAVQLSEDNASAQNGGKLRKFSYGQMIDAFSDVAFSLQNSGDISKPFQTMYGWHIVKLIKKYPIESFEELEPKLLQQVENDERSNLIGKSVIDRLSSAYKIDVNEAALNQFNLDDWKTNPEKFQQKLIKIQERAIYQDTFIQFLKTASNAFVNEQFKMFKEQEILNYYKDNIELTNKEFAAIYKEFEEGLLLFEMLEMQVWEKSKDSIGLANFYDSNKASIYADKDLESNKGLIISDYQNYLEKMWVKGLHQKYKVEFKEEERKQLLEAKID